MYCSINLTGEENESICTWYRVLLIERLAFEYLPALPVIHDGHLASVLKVIIFNDSKPIAHLIVSRIFDSTQELVFSAIGHIPIDSQIVWRTFVLISDNFLLGAYS